MLEKINKHRIIISTSLSLEIFQKPRGHSVLVLVITVISADLFTHYVTNADSHLLFAVLFCFMQCLSRGQNFVSWIALQENCFFMHLIHIQIFIYVNGQMALMTSGSTLCNMSVECGRWPMFTHTIKKYLRQKCMFFFFSHCPVSLHSVLLSLAVFSPATLFSPTVFLSHFLACSFCLSLVAVLNISLFPSFFSSLSHLSFHFSLSFS